MCSILLLVDRLLIPANRKHLPLDKQLQQLLEKFDLTCAMKSSPSRSKRLKLLKKTINDVRSEMSLKKVLPSHHHHSSSSTPSSWPTSSSSTPPLPETPKLEEERPKPNGHIPDDEGWCSKLVTQHCTKTLFSHYRTPQTLSCSL